MCLSNGSKKGTKSEYGGMQRIDRAEWCREECEYLKEKGTGDATCQGDDESDNH